MNELEKPYDLPKNVCLLCRYGFFKAASFLAYCWKKWVARRWKSLQVLGNPYENPRERIITALCSVKQIVMIPRVLFSGGISLVEQDGLHFAGYTIWIKPKNLEEDLVTFVHECWHALLYRNGLFMRKFHNETLIEEHSEIVVRHFREVVFDELAFACGGYQLWFPNVAAELADFRIGYSLKTRNTSNDLWYYKRTGDFPDRRDESLDLYYQVQHRSVK